jgi:hypothetical protein
MADYTSFFFAGRGGGRTQEVAPTSLLHEEGRLVVAPPVADAPGSPLDTKPRLNDLHATILHLFGLDHKRLTCRFQGRDFRLTGVAGTVVAKLPA